ncbi:hypothetical protein [Neobacillus sp. LXY-4]|uniref:hypothetical protein n=1 Tax=Neobacillus sp. LXY-4 TaxID=3379826 RepID=UPI003EE1A3CE
MNDFTLIKVSGFNEWNDVEVISNPTPYKLVGRGVQGAVFKLSNKQCVKIYPEEKHCRWEVEALRKVQASAYFPRFYDSGANYMVMEYIEGTNLKDYLKEKGTIPIEITKQIIALQKEMKSLNFTDYDIYLRHYIVTNNGTIKVIDHVKSFTRNRPVPKYFFMGLSSLGLLKMFKTQVKAIDYEIYSKWKKTMKKYL